MMRKIIAILIICCSLFRLQAQDYTFSNHNIVPFSLNPSVVGNANAARFGLNYRMQWPALGNKYHTVRLSYDQNFYKQMCSVGVAYAYDNMANGVYQVNEFDLVYGHTIRLRDYYFIRLGVQGAFFTNYLNMNKLTFGDQYDPYTNQILPNSIEELEMSHRSFLDFSVGASFVIENLFSIGASVYHIGEPENGFAKKEDNVLKRKYVIHANFVRDLQYRNGLWGRRDLSNNYLFANASYQQQDDFKQAYLGVGVLFDPLMLGVSLKSDLEEVNTVSFMAGAQIQGLQVYYIYDLFTSKKKNGSWSHEISFIYILKIKERFPCPVVYW